MTKPSIMAFILFVLAPTYGSADTFLCGDPPPLSDDKLSGELKSKAQFLSRFLGDAQLEGNIESTRTEVLSKYPNADRVIADQYLLYQTCVMLMKDDSLPTTQKLEELRKMRREFHSTFESQKIYRKCRHPDFGQEGWANEETIPQSSGWVGGGSNPDNWCNTLISQIIQGRSIGPIHKATVLDKSQEARWTWDRRRQYNYHCTVNMKWNPIYAERIDPRCGTM